MSTIEREVFIQAPPAVVAAALNDSRWQPAIAVRPEGAGARVLIRAAATPDSIAHALEMAMLDDVCAVKQRVE